MAIFPTGDSSSNLMAAASAEREASRRIADSHRVVKEAQSEAQKKIDLIEENSDREIETERARRDARLEAERQREFRNARDLKKQAAAEQNRLRQSAEKDLSQLRNHYRESTFKEVQRGENQLDEIRKQSATELEHAQKTLNTDTTQARETHEIQVRQLIDRNRQERESLATQQKQAFEEAQAKSSQAQKEARDQFSRQNETQKKQFDESLNTIWGKANRELREIREKTATQLAAYSDRQEDPFYRLVDLEASIEERDEEFILTARIPPHEREKVTVSLKGNSVVISGVRKNEEKIREKDGSAQGTSSFQSFYQSIPLEWPIDSKKMIRSFEGDQLIVLLPKKNLRTMVPHYEGESAQKTETKSQPEPVRAERPKFPKNLPYAGPSHEKPKT